MVSVTNIVCVNIMAGPLRTDLNEVDALFADNVSYFSSEKQGVIIGKAAVREHHSGFGFKAGGNADKAGNRLWLQHLRFDRVDTATVIVTAIWLFLRAAHAHDERQTQRGPLTAVLTGGRIVHMNFGKY